MRSLASRNIYLLAKLSKCNSNFSSTIMNQLAKMVRFRENCFSPTLNICMKIVQLGVSLWLSSHMALWLKMFLAQFWYMYSYIKMVQSECCVQYIHVCKMFWLDDFGGRIKKIIHALQSFMTNSADHGLCILVVWYVLDYY